MDEQARGLVLETRGVRHQMAHEDRLMETLFGGPAVTEEPIVDRVVEAHLALLDELHDRARRRTPPSLLRSTWS